MRNLQLGSKTTRLERWPGNLCQREVGAHPEVTNTWMTERRDKMVGGREGV